MNVLDGFQQITTFMFDVDGVMTDGTILVLGNGDMARSMNTKDGFALQLAVKKGYRFFIVSGSSPSAVERRMNNLGIVNVYFEIRDKKSFVVQLMEEQGLQSEEVLFMGDDVPDLAAFDAVALACCPADAVADVKNAAKYISPKAGGKGCVRDVIEKVLKCRGDWDTDEKIASS
jgi:3-deoxy-D-manno-octulosonate 8-phosphate phosphatase (KDO 8-P phosphatase)